MEDGLRDIKPLLEISDYSYFIFMGLVVFFAFIVLVALYRLFKKFLLTRKENLRKGYFKRLKNIDWSNTKKAAYEVTFLGRKLATEPRIEEIYGQLVVMLSQYKYKKVVSSVDKETLKQYDLLVYVVNESL
jgi:hypothetical protein